MTSLRALLLALALPGCLASGPRAIERTLGGERRAGVFVSPYSYEHFVRAELARLSGDDATARDEYELARAGAADDPLLCARLAETLSRLGDATGADRAIADGLALDAASEAVHLARGAIAEARGDLETALSAYRAAHEGAPESAAPILAIAHAADRSGAHARARALLRELAEAGPRPDARGVLVARLLGTDDPVELLELATALGASEPRLLSAGARRALALGHPALAARIVARRSARAEDRALRIEIAMRAHDSALLRELLATPPPLDDASALAADARAYLALGQPADAEAHARASLARGSSPSATLALGLALEARGALAEAATTLASVPTESSVGPEARVALGRVLAAAGLPALGDEVGASVR